MSRIGKLPIEIPNGVEVEINGQVVSVKGPLGTEVVELRPEIGIKKEDNKLIVTRINDERQSRSLHGLSRTLVIMRLLVSGTVLLTSLKYKALDIVRICREVL